MRAPVESATAAGTPLAGRSGAPVFVVGCPRSGTTVLYHMLLSAGDFAVYRAESHVFNLLGPRFGNLRTEADRKELLRLWLKSKLFRVSGLDADFISDKIMTECSGSGDFLRVVMQEVARKQGVRRWADCTPEHVLYMTQIKREIPDAHFVHIIRDGRDVALSYMKQGWSHPLPWDRAERLGVAGLYWDWIVRRGREQARHLGDCYHEVRFEDLVGDPRAALEKLGGFVGQKLDFDRIQQAGIGSVSEPNSSFGEESREGFHPVGRWKTKLSMDEVKALETLIGQTLADLKYSLASGTKPATSLRAMRLRSTYFAMFAMKHGMKATPLGRYVNLKNMEIEGA